MKKYDEADIHNWSKPIDDLVETGLYFNSVEYYVICINCKINFENG